MQPINRRNFLAGTGALLLASHSPWNFSKQPVMQVYIGCFTNSEGEKIPASFGTHRGPEDITAGIYTFKFDTRTGKAGIVSLAAACKHPINLIMHSNQRFLYACRGQNSIVDGQNIISAFAIQDDGSLQELNSVRSGGGGPTVGAVDKRGHFLLTTNFSTNSIVCFELEKNGTLGNRVAIIGEEPKGDLPTSSAPGSAKLEPHDPNKTRPHAILLSQSEQFAIATEINTNRCHVLRFDKETGSLKTHQLANDFPEAGPRHLVWHPGHRFLYTSGEEHSSITAWRWNEAAGELTAIQNLSSLPAGFEGDNHPADVVVHPGGNFVYVSNRGAGTIAGYNINQQNGHLTAIEQTEINSASCWSMLFDPSGQWALISAINADAIHIYRFNSKTGALTPTGQSVPCLLPTCLRWRWA